MVPDPARRVPLALRDRRHHLSPSSVSSRTAEAAQLGALAQRFAALVRSSCAGGSQPSDPAGELDIWLDAVCRSDIPAPNRFATGPNAARTAAHVAAVRAAFTTSWSNGQAEGQISRLEMLKRTMYEREGFPLLRRGVIIPA